jgi:L-fuculose-phosphate aldolase
LKQEIENKLVQDVVRGAKAIFNKKLVEVGEGNVSVRYPKKEELFITKSFNTYERMTNDDVSHLMFDGTIIKGNKSPSKEFQLHIALFKSRPKAQCVIHTHSYYATILSVCRKKIPILMEEMILFLGGEVSVSKFGLAHTNEIGKVALDAMGFTNAVLLANHGALVCGRTVDHAVKIAEIVEKMALIYWGALLIGNYKIIPKKVVSTLKMEFDSQNSTF